MALEDVERQSGYHGVAHRILLIEMSADRTRLLVPPSAPLIDHQTDLLLWVFLVHDVAVTLDDVLDLQALGECGVVFVVGERCC